jgi:AcrR family transcriptional regulator
MSDDVKRRYDSSGRQEQARRTRWSVVQTARRRFLDQGYAGTTLAALAEEVGVSVETVYKTFGNKAGLLKAVVDASVAGDDEPVPMVERDFVRRIQDERDPVRKLQLWSDHIIDVGGRTVAVELLVRDAAASDPAAAGVWEQMVTEKLTGMALFAAHLGDGGHLRPGVSVDDARDMLTAYMSPDLYQLLVFRQGWSPERFGRWLSDALAAALLP